MNGSQQALDLITRVLTDPGDAVAIEEPHYDGARETLRAAGARRRNAIIVEDDYDGEFRYDGRPLKSLQGLDPEDRTIYIGTFSRTVFPSLCIGYLVAPEPLMPALTAAKWLGDMHSATLEQKTLGDFIAGGIYERHLRRLRRRNTARREALLDAVRDFLGDRVELTGAGPWSSRNAVAAAARFRNKSPSGDRPARRWYLRHRALLAGRPSRGGFLLGYARLSEPEIREGIRLLGHVL